MNEVLKVQFTGNRYRSHFAFWQKKYEENANGFEFKPSNNGLDENNDHPVQTFDITVSGERFSAITRLGDNDSGIFNCIVTAFSILFHKYSAQHDIIFDSPLLRINFQDSPFVPRVPLLFRVSAANLLKEQLQANQQAIKECYQYQNYPLELIQAEQHPFKTNILVVYDRIHFAFESGHDYDFVFKISRLENAICVNVSVNTAVFATFVPGEFEKHFLNIISAYGDLNNTIGGISILSDADRKKLLVDFNSNFGSNEADPVDKLFQIQCSKTPDSVAVAYDGMFLTYQCLNKSTNRLARCLITEYSVKPGDIVAVMADRSDALIIAVLSILKCGASYLPIDSSQPKSRIKHMLAEANVRVLLTNSLQIFELDFFDGKLFALDVQLQDLSCADTDLPTVSSSDTIAYVIFTSGSTGTPKGVAIKHSSLVNLCQWHVGAFNVAGGSKASMYASVGFDASVWELWPYLIAGGTVFPLDENIRTDIEGLLHYLNLSGITHCFLPTAICEAVLDHDHKLNEQLLILTGGDVFQRKDELRHNVVNNYGPTETTVVATSVNLYHNRHAGVIPVGKPIRNTSIYILRHDLSPAPIGMEGEIYIGGEGLSIGYLNNPELTAEKFVDDPFKNGSKLYATGDLGRWLPDGQIEFLGRADDQIKIRGNRVGLEEIAFVIRSHPGVGDACVYTCETRGGNKSICAAIIPDQHTAATVSEILALRRNDAELAKKMYHLPNNLVILSNNKSETDFIYKEIFEEHVYLRNNITVNKGDVIFDVGGNIGLFSLFMGLHFDDLQLYVFEPVQPIFEVLRENLRLYNIPVNLFNVGLSDMEGSAEFAYYPFLTAISGRYTDEKIEKANIKRYLVNQSDTDQLALPHERLDDILEERLHYENIRVQLRRLSDVIAEQRIQRIDLLKIDVEKSEMDVLRGIDEDDWCKIKQIVIEVHDIDSRVQNIRLLLSEKGFEVTVVQENLLHQTNIFTVYAVRNGFRADRSASVPAHAGADKRWNHPEVLSNELKKFCSENLPGYMVPEQIVCLKEFPYNRNGKIDRQALPRPVDTSALRKGAEAKTDTEIMLKSVWEEVLHRNSIGIDDNFFEIGGDSIKAIQIASKVQQHGYKVEVKDIFQQASIRELASCAVKLNMEIDQSPVYGEIPLTPVQLEFLTGHRFSYHHFNQSIMLQTKQRLDVELLKRVFSEVQKHHDALRITFVRKEGKFAQWNHGLDHALFVELQDLMEDNEPIATLARKAEEVQASLDLATGPLVKVVVFRLKDADRLLMAVHHLVVDTVSWRILLEDIETLYNQLKEQRVPKLPLKTDSFKKWAESLETYANSREFLSEKEYWAKVGEMECPQLLPEAPVDHNFVKDVAGCSFSLSAEETELLLTKVNLPFNTQINDILLVAAGLSIKNVFGLQKILLALEGHGRESLFKDVDISRTVGWFTSVFPVTLDMTYSIDVGRQIKEVKETLRRIPNKGVGYGILKHLTSEVQKREMRFDVQPRISFNYLGQFETGGDSAFSFAEEFSGNVMSPQEQRDYILDINGLVRDKVLQITILYNKHHYRPETMERLSDEFSKNLRNLITFCSALKHAEATPSDFIYKDLAIEDLNSIFD